MLNFEKDRKSGNPQINLFFAYAHYPNFLINKPITQAAKQPITFSQKYIEIIT